jgi:hypothetical protein
MYPAVLAPFSLIKGTSIAGTGWREVRRRRRRLLRIALTMLETTSAVAETPTPENIHGVFSRSQTRKGTRYCSITTVAVRPTGMRS